MLMVVVGCQLWWLLLGGGCFHLSWCLSMVVVGSCELLVVIRVVVDRAADGYRW